MMDKVKVVAGLGEKKSNGGTQYYQQDRIYDTDGIAPSLMKDKADLLMEIKQIGNIAESKRENPEVGRVYDTSGISPTLNSMQGGQRQPKTTVKNATKQGYLEIEDGGVMDIAFQDSETRGGRVIDEGQTAPTLDTGCQVGRVEGMRIRRLTPKECFRLQGFPDEYYERAAEVNSDSQLYKQAGNSVTVNVIYEIARRLK